ncbi:MAG: type II secretion system F family protein [Actinomycetes bacterium]
MRLAWAFVFAAGVLCLFGPRSGAGRRRRARVEGRAVAISAATGVGGAVVVLVVVGVPALAVIAGIVGATAPFAARRAGVRRRAEACRAAWPEAVELLAGTVRSGETLVGAIGVAAERGPEVLRPDLAAVAAEHRVSGDLDRALARMRDAGGDPIVDRVASTLLLIHRVGGRASAEVLHTLAAFLRDDLALRREVVARQSWTTVAARVAVAAPWLVVVLVSARGEGRSAYSTPVGAVVLTVGAVVTCIGYRIMVMAGRIDDTPRVVTT